MSARDMAAHEHAWRFPPEVARLNSSLGKYIIRRSADTYPDLVRDIKYAAENGHGMSLSVDEVYMLSRGLERK